MTTASAALPADYGPLVRELHRRAAAQRQPVNGTFELTERCNLACRMCYVRQAPGDGARRAQELPAAAWLDLARQAVDNGMVFLLLTGGEVFLRPDFFEIYTPLTRMGLILTLFTNGTLITEAIAARLAEAPPSRTEITLYGATAATYEAVTGVPGSYARCCAGIEALVKHRVPLGLKSTLTRRNVDELEAMRQMAHNLGPALFGGLAAFQTSRRRAVRGGRLPHVRRRVRGAGSDRPRLRHASGPKPPCANRRSAMTAISTARPAGPPLSSIRWVK